LIGIETCIGSDFSIYPKKLEPEAEPANWLYQTQIKATFNTDLLNLKY
jgi:hypothetical protein